jgi:plastocyanin
LGHATNAQLASYATNAQVTTFLTNAQMFTYVINQQFATNSQLTLYATNAQLTAITTASVSEGTNLYYSNARVYANVLSLGLATNAQLSLYATNAQLVANATTANVTEVTNLYFTNTRAVGAFTAGSGISIAANGLLVSTVTGNVTSNVITVAGASGDVSNAQLASGITSSGILTTANVSEETNLYYSNARVSANVATLGYAANSFVVNQLSQIYYPAVARLSVTNSGASAYLFNSHYTGNNPNLYTISGTTISFALDVTGHPFLLQEDSGGGFANITSTSQLFHLSTTGTLSTGSSAQGQVAGTLYWNVPYSGCTSSTFRYICSVHSNMVGNVIVKDISVI